MYNLIVTDKGNVLRAGVPVAARQALLDWQERESIGYDVTCRDQDGNPVTKAQLRDVLRNI